MGVKNFKSTQSLYGVSPGYFEGKGYFEALKEKVRLGNEMIKELNNKIDYHLPENEYKELIGQLNACQKAVNFNETLLLEYKIYKDRKDNNASN